MSAGGVKIFQYVMGMEDPFLFKHTQYSFISLSLFLFPSMLGMGKG
jgi:hypothetical protein